MCVLLRYNLFRCNKTHILYYKCFTILYQAFLKGGQYILATRTDNKTPLGKLILKRLYLKGKNQAWLAEQIGANPNHISVLCSRIKNPKVETLKKLSKALDIELEDLYRAVAETVEITEK